MIRLIFAAVVAVFRVRADLVLENVALRQQVAVFKRKNPRPRLHRRVSEQQRLSLVGEASGIR